VNSDTQLQQDCLNASRSKNISLGVSNIMMYKFIKQRLFDTIDIKITNEAPAVPTDIVPSGAMNGTIELPPLNPVYSSLTRA
jgi:hypothetical protein